MTDSATAAVRLERCRVLGLPADQMLKPDDVIAAWRQANLRWHPKRPGADPVRHLAAQTAYAYLLNHLDPPASSTQALLLNSPIGGDSAHGAAPQATILASPPRTPINSTHSLLHTPKPLPAPPPPNYIERLKPPYSIRHHNGADKLCLELRIPLRRLVEGDRVRFKHLNGKEYGLTVPPGTWGGTAELPGLGLTPADPLLILLCPFFPSGVPPKARQLIAEGLALCDETEAHSLILHELIPALTR